MVSRRQSISVVSATRNGTNGVPYARGIRAGDWIFVPGLLPDDLGDPQRPLSGVPAWVRQANSLWRQTSEILEKGGADISRMVRSDQFVVDWRAMSFFHQARREACGSYIAPSTSVLQPEMLIPGATMMTDIMAVATGGAPIEPITPSGLDLPSTSSFTPVAKVGDFVFVAGFLAACGEGDLGGIAPEAKVPEGHLWKGNRIQLETRYLIRRKLIPALAGAGLGLEDVVKATALLYDVNDVPAFNQVWAEEFKGNIPATTIVPTSQPGFAIADAKIEINLIANANRKATARLQHPGAEGAVCDGHPVAIRSGDLLLFSSLMAADGGGLIDSARQADKDRYRSSSIEAQMEYLLDIAQEVCEQAGTGLHNVVRASHAFTDLKDFLPACRVWERRLSGQALPISAVRVPAPLIVPGCSVQLDLWVHAP